MRKPLAHVVTWSHRLLSEIINPGDFTVDLTAGNGYDTLMLAQAVGPSGRVLAFDLQEQALQESAERLRQHGIVVNRFDSPSCSLTPGVSLVRANHAELAAWCDVSPRVIMANLGYLPGGNKSLVTKSVSTLTALRKGCDLLAVGGRIAIVAYTEHAGGRAEAEAVDQFFVGLDETKFEVLRLAIANRPQAPFLLVAGKLK